MTMPEPSSITAADVAAPGMDAATLGQIAAVRPDLWSAILAHLNCYPELAGWIRQRMPAVAEESPAPESIQSAAHRDRWSVPFERATYDLVTSEVQFALDLQVMRERRKSAGARRPSAGGKDHVADTVAPAAGAAKSIKLTTITPPGAG